MKRFKHIWFAFFVLVLSLPMLQNLTGLISEDPLNGAFVPAVKPGFEIKSFFNENYQDSLTRYVEENIGFHNSLVRLNNQLIFTVFRQSPVDGPVIGKNGILFEESYIISYLGRTFIGEELIQKNSKQLKLVQEILAAKNIELLVVFAPGKASFFPESIPKKYKPNKKSINNYEAYISEFEKLSVNIIDFNSMFLKLKDTVNNPFYCNLGAHWTVYASSIAVDSLVKYMEHKTKKKHANFEIIDFEISDSLRDQDDDLFKTMNIIFKPSHNQIAYPIFRFNNDASYYRPKVLAISDSYWWTIYAHNIALPQNLFANGGFWFYNKTIYPVREPLQNVEEISYKEEIENQEFILLVCTEATNHLFPFDFCEKYLKDYEESLSNKLVFSKADSVFLKGKPIYNP